LVVKTRKAQRKLLVVEVNLPKLYLIRTKMAMLTLPLKLGGDDKEREVMVADG
jgi:hypothetical protein